VERVLKETVVAQVNVNAESFPFSLNYRGNPKNLSLDKCSLRATAAKITSSKLNPLKTIFIIYLYF
jgi:hypothetical protein